MLELSNSTDNGRDTAFDAIACANTLMRDRLSSNDPATRQIAPQEHLFYEADQATHCYEVLEGSFCIYKLLPDGRRYIVSFAMAGDLIGFGDADVHRLSAEAVEASSVRPIDFGSMDQAIMTTPGLAQKLMQQVKHELAEAREQLVTVARKSALEKLATFIVKLSHRNAVRGDDELVVNLPMTRADIADFLGLTLETVSRTMSKLKRTGIIDLPQSSVVVIRDLDKLEELAEF